ncbi:hypothetical protein FACS1894182_15280 [Bacteroidia bacterium]|nr:hypothetical protein FACS1894182_15280 [Bacteroidia bacterium]
MLDRNNRIIRWFVPQEFARYGKIRGYYNTILKHEGVAPEDCTPEICKEIISNHLSSPSMLSIIPLQDWLAMDKHIRAPNPDSERINIPAHSRHYWRYRMPLTIEELLTADTLNETIRNLIQRTARNN